MGLDHDIRTLAQVELFRGFGDEPLRLLAFGADAMTVAAGRVLYREGDAADCGFVLVSGTIVHQIARADGNRELGRDRPVALLGDIALITESTRPTTAIAETDCTVLRLNRQQFRRILDEWPDLARLVHDRLSASLVGMIERLGAVRARLK